VEVLKLAHDYEVRAVAFSPDGRLLAAGGGRWQKKLAKGPGTVYVWRLQDT
jgi:hypothetical protein